MKVFLYIAFTLSINRKEEGKLLERTKQYIENDLKVAKQLSERDPEAEMDSSMVHTAGTQRFKAIDLLVCERISPNSHEKRRKTPFL